MTIELWSLSELYNCVYVWASVFAGQWLDRRGRFLPFASSSDATIIEIEIDFRKSIFLRKIERNRCCDFFEQVWADSDTVSHWVTGDRRRRSQNGFYTPASPITQSAEEFGDTGAKKSNQHQILYKNESKSNREENRNLHITSLKVFFQSTG